MSRDFFTNFSLAMVNGHAVARCDFKMTFRGLRGEPVPYTVLAPEHRSVGSQPAPHRAAQPAHMPGGVRAFAQACRTAVYRPAPATRTPPRGGCAPVALP